MRTGQRLYLIKKNLGQNLGRSALSCAAVSIGMAIFLTALSFALGIQFNIVSRLREAMPERIVSVQRATANKGLLRITPPITDADVAQLRKMPEVETVWPQVPIMFPIRAEGSLLGIELSTDVVVNGIDPSLVQMDVAPGKKFVYAPNSAKPVPVMVSRYLLDMYNLGYARANSLPELDEKWTIGHHFKLILGQSTLPLLGNNPKARYVECEVVGLTSNPSLLGVVIPADYARQFNREFSVQPQAQYSALHIRLRPSVDIDAFEQKMAAMDLRPDAQRELIRRAQFFLKMLLLVLFIFSALVLFLAFSNVVNTFSLILLQRRFEIGLLRAVGATRAAVVGLFVGEAGLLGALGGLIGSGLAFLLAFAINWMCRTYLPSLSILPSGQQFMFFNGGLACAGIIFSAAVSIAATFPTVLRATGLQPAVLLRHE